MCNLYSIKTRHADLARTFRLFDNRMAAFDPLEAIFPGHMAPIIKQSEDAERELVLRNWGFILLREGYAPKRVTNARDDKIHTKFWKDSFEKRRCLVPATSFCEPDEGKPAKWHWFALKPAGVDTPCASGHWFSAQRRCPLRHERVDDLCSGRLHDARRRHEPHTDVLVPAPHDLAVSLEPIEADDQLKGVGHIHGAD